MEFQEEKVEGFSEKPIDIIKRNFLEEREVWRDRVKAMAVRMREIHNLAELQVDLFSSRQEAVEYHYNIAMQASKFEGDFFKERKKVLEEYNNKDVRYGKADLNQIVDGACADRKHIADVVKSHSSYMYETVRTIDNMIFGIKHRIELEGFRTMS